LLSTDRPSAAALQARLPLVFREPAMLQVVFGLLNHLPAASRRIVLLDLCLLLARYVWNHVH